VICLGCNHGLVCETIELESWPLLESWNHGCEMHGSGLKHEMSDAIRLQFKFLQNQFWRTFS